MDDPFTSQIHQAQQQQQQQQQKAASAPLKKPPKWLRRPCGATFAVSLTDQAKCTGHVPVALVQNV